jgi:hypothetical protein
LRRITDQESGLSLVEMWFCQLARCVCFCLCYVNRIDLSFGMRKNRFLFIKLSVM